MIHWVRVDYLFFVVAAAEFALDGSFFFDPLFEAGDVYVLDGADALAGGAHAGVGLAQVDADPALVVQLVAQVRHAHHRACRVHTHRAVHVPVFLLPEPLHAQRLVIEYN